jgi:hypothetical protein
MYDASIGPHRAIAKLPGGALSPNEIGTLLEVSDAEMGLIGAS